MENGEKYREIQDVRRAVIDREEVSKANNDNEENGKQKPRFPDIFVCQCIKRLHKEILQQNSPDGEFCFDFYSTSAEATIRSKTARTVG